MNIAVLVKQVPDTETKFKLNGNEIDQAGIKWILNPYDEHAVEEAIKLKTAEAGSKVTVISLGPKRAAESIRTALAMGADEGIHILTSDSSMDPQSTAKALAEVLKGDNAADIIFSGWKAIDDDAAQVSQAVAEHLGIASAFQVTSFEKAGDHVVLKRELEGGSAETIELPLPCIVACQKGLNKPRYASLPGIMQAKKKPLKEIPVSEVGGENSTETTISMELPSEKGPGKIVKISDPSELGKSVEDLVKFLKEEAKVI